MTVENPDSIEAIPFTPRAILRYTNNSTIPILTHADFPAIDLQSYYPDGPNYFFGQQAQQSIEAIGPIGVIIAAPCELNKRLRKKLARQLNTLVTAHPGAIVIEIVRDGQPDTTLEVTTFTLKDIDASNLTDTVGAFDTARKQWNSFMHYAQNPHERESLFVDMQCYPLDELAARYQYYVDDPSFTQLAVALGLTRDDFHRRLLELDRVTGNTALHRMLSCMSNGDKPINTSSFDFQLLQNHLGLRQDFS